MRTRTCRQTGRPVTVGRAADLGLDPCDGYCAWYCVCDEHGTILGHSSRRLAESWAAVPVEWCDYCREGIEPDT